MKFCVRKRKKFEEDAAPAPPSPGDNVVLEVDVGDEVEIRSQQDHSSRSPLDELRRIAEGRGESTLDLQTNTGCPLWSDTRLC